MNNMKPTKQACSESTKNLLTTLEVNSVDMSIHNKTYKFKTKIPKTVASERLIVKFLEKEVSPRIAVFHYATYGKTWKVSFSSTDVIVEHDDEDAMVLFALKNMGFE